MPWVYIWTKDKFNGPIFGGGGGWVRKGGEWSGDLYPGRKALQFIIFSFFQFC